MKLDSFDAFLHETKESGRRVALPREAKKFATSEVTKPVIPA